MKLLEFLPLIANEIKEDLALSCVIALQNWHDYKINNYAYFIAFRQGEFCPLCIVSEFEGDLITYAKRYANSQFFKLEIVDGKASITEL